MAKKTTEIVELDYEKLGQVIAEAVSGSLLSALGVDTAAPAAKTLSDRERTLAHHRRAERPTGKGMTMPLGMQRPLTFEENMKRQMETFMEQWQMRQQGIGEAYDLVDESDWGDDEDDLMMTDPDFEFELKPKGYTLESAEADTPPLGEPSISSDSAKLSSPQGSQQQTPPNVTEGNKSEVSGGSLDKTPLTDTKDSV